MNKLMKIAGVAIAISLTLWIHEAGHYLVFQAWGVSSELSFLLFPIIVGVKTETDIHSLPILILWTAVAAGPMMNFAVFLVVSRIFATGSFQTSLKILGKTIGFLGYLLLHPMEFFKSSGSVIGIFREGVRMDLIRFVWTLNLGLGVMQLVPISPLDGWKLIAVFFYPFVPYRLMQAIEVSQTLVLLVFMIFLMFKDIGETNEDR